MASNAILDSFDDFLSEPIPAFAPGDRIRGMNRFLVYKLEPKADGSGYNKIPHNPKNSQKANNPSLGVSLAEADAYCKKHEGFRIGLYIQEQETPDVVVIDLDKCVTETGDVEPWAVEIVRGLNSYTEASPSGTGLHIFVRGVKPGTACRRGIEIYSCARFVSLTGLHVAGTPDTINECDLKPIYEKMLRGEFQQPEAAQRDASEKPRMMNEVVHYHGAITTKLALLMTGDFVENSTPFTVSDEGDQNEITFPSQSEAIGSLLGCLAIKHEGDAEKMENEFLQSSLYRGISKWNAEGGKWQRLGKGELKTAVEKYSASVSKTVAPPSQTAEPEPDEWPYAMTREEYEAECDAEYPVFPLRETAGPVLEDADIYGPLGQITRKICGRSEAYPPTVYLNLIITLGCAFGRGAYFNVDSTKHYTIDFLACVGSSSVGRKGTSSDGAESIVRLLCGDFMSRRNCTGFASPQAVIDRIKDASTYQQRDRKSGGYKTVLVPGVEDKRLCVRENELSGLFKLLSDPKTKAGELFRNLWDGKPASNIVAGKTDEGESRSLTCKEPHVAVIGSTTPSLVKATLPIGADTSGDGNRFLWCHTKRTQLCPNGGPPIDWASEMITYAGKSIPLLVYMQDVLVDAGEKRLIPLTKPAAKFWTYLYLRLENDQRTGFLGGMTSRSAAHIRRLAMILALVDLEGAIDVKHLKAAEAIWNYSQESARFIFKGYSLEQEKILRFAESKGSEGITVGRDLHKMFGNNKSGAWLKAQVKSLADGGFLIRNGDQYRFKKH
jgi:hypothetical protein